jgi:HPt (histidine-containing phosphotransfer) domain-containing protein
MSVDDDAAAVQAKVDMLAKIFKGRLHVRFEKMNETFALCQADGGNEEHWVELHRLLHSLGGAAGSFGFDELGAHATFIELRIKDMLGQQKHPHDVAEIGQAIAALQSTH